MPCHCLLAVDKADNDNEAMSAQDARRIGSTLVIAFHLPLSVVGRQALRALPRERFFRGDASMAVFRELSRAYFCSLESSLGVKKVSAP